MKFRILFFISFFWFGYAFAQTAPPHLKYFGFAVIDCLYDDPLDSDTITNYITEVDSFSNVAHMCVYDPTSNITTRVTTMNNLCVNPIVHIQNIFYEYVDTNGLGGENFDLRPDYVQRWNTFKTLNFSVLDQQKIGAFYIADEPYWKGFTFQDLDVVGSLIKADYPNIPIMIIEASGALQNMQVPTSIDWLSFDDYGKFDPSTDPTYLAELALLKSKRSTPNQKIFLTVDDQWLPLYGAAGFPPDTIRFMVQNYYNLAASDTEIVGLLCYLWPGGLDDPGHLGVRNMPQSVIDKNVEIGLKIKANYNPCLANSIQDISEKSIPVSVFPNPATNEVEFVFPENLKGLKLTIYNSLGQVVLRKLTIDSERFNLNISNFSSSVYFFSVESEKEILSTGKFIKN